MIMKFLVLLPLFAVTSQAFFFGPSQDWDGLRVTWGLNPFSSYTFAHIPRRQNLAEPTDGWTLYPPAASEKYFCGNRFIKFDDSLESLDNAVMPLYDKQGYIAGIQTGIPDNLPNRYPNPKIVPPFIHEPSKGMYTLTAYFSPPDVVCGSGRTESQFTTDGTGTELHLLLRRGNETVKMPYSESGIEGTKWVEGKCFISMGQHYWYDVSSDMSCDDSFPMFLMYNGGRLNAFGFAFLADLRSPRFEHPSFSDVGRFMKPVPKCLENYDTFSTIHIYMDKRPRTNTC